MLLLLVDVRRDRLGSSRYIRGVRNEPVPHICSGREQILAHSANDGRNMLEVLWSVVLRSICRPRMVRRWREQGISRRCSARRVPSTQKRCFDGEGTADP